jgi:hypothetical protein
LPSTSSGFVLGSGYSNGLPIGVSSARLPV